MFTIQEMRQLEEMKMLRSKQCCKNKCCSVITKGFYCGRCRKLSQKLCRQYHILKDSQEYLPEASSLARKEVKERLKYEYVFDIVTLEDIEVGSWLYNHKRDTGHQRRIEKLVAIIYDDNFRMTTW
jgi:hypothetical protein